MKLPLTSLPSLTPADPLLWSPLQPLVEPGKLHFPTSCSQQLCETPSPKPISLINELADKPLGPLVISGLPIQFFSIPFVNLTQLLTQRTIDK